MPVILELQKYYFANAELFSNISARERMRLLNEAETKKMRSGKMFYREGSDPKGVYILKKGKVKIFQSLPSGRKQILHILTSGDIFGYRPIICGEVHPVTAMALEECTYDHITNDQFLECLEQSHELRNALLVSLSCEYSVWVNMLAVHAQYPVRSRVALALLVLREKYKTKGKLSPINLSRDDLAGYIGTVKESVVRVLQDFKKRKLVETNGRKIMVLKPEELKTIVRFY
jgi:CRP-like cAMP-binding protein